MKKRNNKREWIGLLPLTVGFFLLVSALILAMKSMSTIMFKPLFFSEVTAWTKFFNLGIWYVVAVKGIEELFEGLYQLKIVRR